MTVLRIGALVCALHTVNTLGVAEAQTPINKVVVAQFDAPKDSTARAAVLEKLSEHGDVDVVALEDVAFVARRLHVDPKQPAGRAKLSLEMGIEAWLDAEVTDSEAHVTLTDAQGTVLASADAEAEQPAQLASLTSERMWAAMGLYLSTSETHKRRLIAENALARKKVERRAEEAERQRRLAQHRFASGATPAAETAPQPREMVAAAPSARRETGRETTSAAAHNALASGANSASAWNAASGQAPVGPNGVSAATQRWLEQQRAATPAAQGTNAHAFAPLEPAAASGISPATQRWLEQQKIR